MLSDNIDHLDDMLKTHIYELKNQAEENSYQYGLDINFLNNFYAPKDPNYFKNVRRSKNSAILDCYKGEKTKILSDDLKWEIESCSKSDYNEKSLGMLIRQSYQHKLSELVNMKKMLMIRFQRYLFSNEMKAEVSKEYDAIINFIHQECMYVKKRITALESSCESWVCNSENNIEDLTKDDYRYYSNYLTINFYQIRFLCHVIRFIQWLPQLYKKKQFKVERKISTDSSDERSTVYSYESLKYDHLASYTQIQTQTQQVDVNAIPPLPSKKFLINTNKLFVINTDNLVGFNRMIATDEEQFNVPLYNNNINDFKNVLQKLCSSYNINYKIDSIQNFSDELDLLSIVTNKFKSHFKKQQQMRLFNVYGKLDGRLKNSYVNAYLKPATWLSEVIIQPKTSLLETLFINELQSGNYEDEQLISTSYFLKQTDVEEIQKNIRHYAWEVQHKSILYPTSVLFNPVGLDVSHVFNKVYHKNEADESLKKIQNSINKTRNSTKYFNSKMKQPEDYSSNQSMHNHSPKSNNDYDSNTRGAYLSYLFLRILRIRDVQRQCLSILNYFRSIERTLTMNKPQSSQANSKSNMSYKSEDNIGYHRSNSYKSQDKMSENGFKDYSAFDNSEDFYFRVDDSIYVCDVDGIWIMYDVALEDFKKLEKYLILVGSYYINKEKDLRRSSLFKRKTESELSSDKSNYDIPIQEYSHQDVDRFGVLFDLWNHHAAFLESKLNLVEMHMEVYNMVVCDKARQQISEKIVDIIYRKPRLSFNSEYCISEYRAETIIVEKMYLFLKCILEKDFVRSSNYSKTFIQSNITQFIPNHLMSIHTNRPIICTPSLSEFCQSWSILPAVHDALDIAVSSLYHPDDLDTKSVLKKEVGLWDFLNDKMNDDELDNFGIGYNKVIRNNILSPVLIDDPQSISRITDQFFDQIDYMNSRDDKRYRKLKEVTEISRLFELITLRFRLIDCLIECEIMHDIYTYQATILEYDISLAFTPFVSFEQSDIGNILDCDNHLLYTSTIQDDETTYQKFTSSTLDLAIHEIDKPDFTIIDSKNEMDILKMLEKMRLEYFRDLVKLQLLHKSALSVSILLTESCKPTLYQKMACKRISQTDAKTVSELQNNIGSEENQILYTHAISLISGPMPIALEKNRIKNYNNYDIHPEAFFPIQYEKVFVRNQILVKYLRKYPELKNLRKEHIKKIKQEYIGEFVSSFCVQVQVCALKAQIIGYYSSIIRLVNLIPDIKNEFFEFGNEVFFSSHGVFRQRFEFESLGIKNRFKSSRHSVTCENEINSVLSKDCKNLLNMWYIPHFTEVLFMFRKKDGSQLNNQTLRKFLRFVIVFHDILHYFVGMYWSDLSAYIMPEYIRNNSTQDSFYNPELSKHQYPHSSKNIHFNEKCADSSYESLRKVLFELHWDIKDLGENPKLEEVSDMLEMKLNFHFYYIDVTFNVFLKELLMATEHHKLVKNNLVAYNSTKYFLPNAKFQNQDSLFITRGNAIPSFILNMKSELFKEVCPWRYLYQVRGLSLNMFDTWINYARLIQLNWEIYPLKHRKIVKYACDYVKSMLTSVLTDSLRPMENSVLENAVYSPSFLLSKRFKTSLKKHKKTNLQFKNDQTNIEKVNLQQTYKLLIEFLHKWKCLEIFRKKLCSFNLPAHQINNCNNCKNYSMNILWFRNNFLIPFLYRLSIRNNKPFLYLLGPLSGDDIFTYPRGLSVQLIFSRMLDSLVCEVEKLQINRLISVITSQIDYIVKIRHKGKQESEINAGCNTAYTSSEILKTSFYKNYDLVNLFYDLILTKTDLSKNTKSVNNIQKSNLSTIMLLTENADFNTDTNDYTNDTECSSMPSSNLTCVKQNGSWISLDKSQLNEALELFCITEANYNKQEFLMYAMYFESLLKNQRIQIQNNQITIEELRSQLNNLNDMNAVQKKFRFAESIHTLIKEINQLRGMIKQEYQRQENLKKMIESELLSEYGCLIHKMHCMGYEALSQLKVAKYLFQKDVNNRLVGLQMQMATVMHLVKKTTNDEILLRNNELTHIIMKKSRENRDLKTLLIRLKALFNWIFSHSASIYRYQLLSKRKYIEEYQLTMTIFTCDQDQRMLLYTLEINHLENVIVSNKSNVENLKVKLAQEQKKSMKVQAAIQDQHETLQRSLQLKSTKIIELSEQLTNLSLQYKEILAHNENNKANKISIKQSTNKEIQQLKKKVDKERMEKIGYFKRIDELLAQIFDFEASISILRHRASLNRTSKTLRKIENAPEKNLQTLENKKLVLPVIKPKQSLNTIEERRNIKPVMTPYTSEHYISFRRNNIEIQKLHTEIANDISNSDILIKSLKHISGNMNQ